MGFGANLRAAEYARVQSFAFSNIEKFSTASLVTRLTSDAVSYTHLDVYKRQCWACRAVPCIF